MQYRINKNKKALWLNYHKAFLKLQAMLNYNDHEPNAFRRLAHIHNVRVHKPHYVSLLHMN
jgi:hypothetical protein